MLVVLPEPFTPHTITTVGPLAASFTGASSCAINCFSFILTTSSMSSIWITRA